MSELLSPDVSNFLAKEERIRTTGIPIAEKFPLPSRDQIPDELFSIVDVVKGISSTWNPVEIYTADADSIAVEQPKVFEAYDRDEEYNPVLTYSYANGMDLTTSRQALMEQLHILRCFGKESTPDKQESAGKHTLSRVSRLFRAALYFKIKDDLATCDLVDGIKEKDDRKISAALKFKYSGTDDALLGLAEGIFNGLASEKIAEAATDQPEQTGLLTSEQKTFIKSMKINSSGIKGAFEWALNEYGILSTKENPRGYKVKIDRNATGIDVRDKSVEGPTVFIPEDREVTGKYLLELIAHEIERHAVQSCNGSEMFIVGGGRLKIDEEGQYEGLGLRGEEELVGKLFGESSGPAPYYSLAAKKAEDGASFFEVFKEQVERRLRVALKKPLGSKLPEEIDIKILDTAKKNAWTTTYRVMRGHIDMANTHNFAMSKDIGYLRGYQIDSQLKEHGYGYLNEAAIIATGGLQLLAELDIYEDMLPIKFKDVATKYCMEILIPQMERTA